MYVIDKELFKMYNSLLNLEHKYNGYNINTLKNYLKSNIIDSDSLNTFDSINRGMYTNGFFNNKYLNDFLLDNTGLLGYVTCYRFKNSYYQKTKRLKKRINKILDTENCFFLTFTFDNKKLRKKDVNLYSKKYLRNLVTTWLKLYCNNYVGNIDFGGKNGRVHFHCVVSLKADKVNHKTWKYGALNFERIINKDSTPISLYVNKLCSHALKESTKNQYLIYPKKNT